MAKLNRGVQSIAVKMQEAVTQLSQSNIYSRLQDALRDACQGMGWAYVLDIFGDDESGDVVYCMNGETYRTSYVMGSVAGKAATCSIDIEGAVDVVPRTVYEPEAEDEDHYTAMQESLAALKLYTDLPLYERFISKKERDAASADDFAGKGRSFPILKPDDVMAAARSIGRAGSGNAGPTGLKSRIIAIAKRKGWEKYLPKSWQGEGSSSASEALRTQPNSLDTATLNALKQAGILTEAQVESALAIASAARGTLGALSLTEAASTLEAIVLREAKADYEIKLIAPGKGASAFYPAEVLKRDGPKVFKAGTHVYLNHPTAAEEAARPVGDVKNLAGVLTTAAAYSETHAKGAGLYARMKVFADHGQLVEERAPHVGMSIRAGGIAEDGKKHEGLPILKEFTYADSVDVVTRPGAGGMIVTESATGPKNEGANEMDEAQIKALIESGIKAGLAAHKDTAVVGLLERARKGDATVIATRVLSSISLAEASKQRVIETVVAANIPVTAAGELDEAKFTELVNAEAKREGAYVASLLGSGRVVGMGSAPVEPTPEEAKRLKEEQAAVDADATAVFQLFGMTEAQAKMAAGKAA